MILRRYLTATSLILHNNSTGFKNFPCLKINLKMEECADHLACPQLGIETPAKSKSKLERTRLNFELREYGFTLLLLITLFSFYWYLCTGKIKGSVALPWVWIGFLQTTGLRELPVPPATLSILLVVVADSSIRSICTSPVLLRLILCNENQRKTFLKRVNFGR